MSPPSSRDGPRARLVHVTTVPMSLTFLRGQVGYIKANGFEVHAVSSSGPDLIDFGEAESVTTHAVEMPRRITPLRDLGAVRRLLRVLSQIRPDVVHAHTPKGGLLGMIAAWLFRAPVRIYHMRGLPLMGATGARRLLLLATEWVSCKLAHRVLCVSHSVREEAVNAGICPATKIKVLLGGSGNGVDASLRFNPDRQSPSVRAATRERFGIPDEATVIGFVGRLVADKGIVELASAWRSLREKQPNLHLLLVGPFEPFDPVPEATEAALRNDPRVHLAGMDWNTPPLYSAMDLVVLPTYREGFPNVPLEAAAMGLPIVATRIPGCIDAVVDGTTGILVEAKDAVALEKALDDYISDPILRRRHAEAARARVLKDFRQEAIWEALLEEYRELLQAAYGSPERKPLNRPPGSSFHWLKRDIPDAES